VRANHERFTGGSLRLVEANCEYMPFPDGEASHDVSFPLNLSSFVIKNNQISMFRILDATLMPK
jgi:hypothetical protein